MKLDLRATNTSANKRCVYFDTDINDLSDLGLVSRFDTNTGTIQCESYHLTDFSIEEYDPMDKTTTMPPNLNRVDVF